MKVNNNIKFYLDFIVHFRFGDINFTILSVNFYHQLT